MPLFGRRVCAIVVVLGLTLAASGRALAVLPAPVRLALTFERPLWTADATGPVPPGHVVIEWSRDGSS